MRQFIDALNQQAQKDPFLKLLILKGFLHKMEDYYGPKYKMGALCRQLLDCIHMTARMNVPPEQKRALRELSIAKYEQFNRDRNNLDKKAQAKRQKP